MKTFSLLLAASLLLAITLPCPAGTTYTVSISDSGGGEGRSFKTVAGGILRIKEAGDELVISRGVYTGSLELRNAKGAPSSPILIRGVREAVPEAEASQPGAWLKYATVIKADKDHALKLIDCSHVTIDSLVFMDGQSHGIVLENCDHITIRNCDVMDNVRTQVYVTGGSHVTLESCELSGSRLEHGCQMMACDQPVVRNCVVHHNAAAGIAIDGDKKGGGDGLVDQPVIENNVVYANGRLKAGAPRPRDDKGRELPIARLRYGNAGICGDGLERGMIRNNLVYRNHVGGLVLYRQHAARAGRSNRVLHNTIYLSAECGSAFGVYLALMSQDTQMYNNIVVSAQGPAFYIGEGSTRDLRSDHNVFFRLDNKDPIRRDKEDLSFKRWQEAYRQDRHSIVFKPPFADPDNEDLVICDYQIKAESSLGAQAPFNWEAQTDCLGRWRPRDKVTPGCYELKPADQNPSQPPPSHGRHGAGSLKPPPANPNDTKKPPPADPILPPI